MKSAQPAFAVLTRPPGRNETLAQKLTASGWQVQVSPALTIVTRMLPQSESPIAPGDFDLVVFVSAPAVTGYLEQHGGTCIWPATTIAACVGVATAQAIRHAFGASVRVIHPDTASSQDSEALWSLISTLADRPRRVLIVRGQDGRDWLAGQCASEGMSVTLHTAYCRAHATWTQQSLSTFHQWSRTDVWPVWLLTSPHGIAAVAQQMEQAGLRQWGKRCRYIVTHPRLSPVVQAAMEPESGNLQILVSRSDEASILSCFEQFRADAATLI